MSVKTFLDSLAHGLVKALKIAVKDAAVVEPIVDLAVPALAPIYNTTVSFITAVESASQATGTTGNGALKMASVVQAIEPIAVSYLQGLGVPQPTTVQIEAYAQAIYDSLVAFGSVVSTATTPPATT